MDVIAALQGVPALGPCLPWLILAAAICAAVATILPAPAPTAPVWWVIVYRAINLVALNVGRARNADDAAAKRAGLQILALLLAAPLAACGADGQLTPAGKAAVSTAVTLAEAMAAQNATVAAVVEGGQLFCRGSIGIVALLKAGQQPTSVIGRGAGLVADACATIGAVPVSPPPNPGAVPVVVAPAAGL